MSDRLSKEREEHIRRYHTYLLDNQLTADMGSLLAEIDALRAGLTASQEERDEERICHDQIATLCHEAGASNPDGTSIGAVKNVLLMLTASQAALAAAFQVAADIAHNHAEHRQPYDKKYSMAELNASASTAAFIVDEIESLPLAPPISDELMQKLSEAVKESEANRSAPYRYEESAEPTERATKFFGRIYQGTAFVARIGTKQAQAYVDFLNSSPRRVVRG